MRAIRSSRTKTTAAAAVVLVLELRIALIFFMSVPVRANLRAGTDQFLRGSRGRGRGGHGRIKTVVPKGNSLIARAAASGERRQPCELAEGFAYHACTPITSASDHDPRALSSVYGVVPYTVPASGSTPTLSVQKVPTGVGHRLPAEPTASSGQVLLARPVWWMVKVLALRDTITYAPVSAMAAPRTHPVAGFVPLSQRICVQPSARWARTGSHVGADLVVVYTVPTTACPLGALYTVVVLEILATNVDGATIVDDADAAGVGVVGDAGTAAFGCGVTGLDGTRAAGTALDGTGAAVTGDAASEGERDAAGVDDEHPATTTRHATMTTVNDARAALLLVSTWRSSSPTSTTLSVITGIQRRQT